MSDVLRSPRAIENDHGPTCDGPNGDCSKMILGRDAAEPLMMLKLQADDARRNGDFTEERRLRDEFNQQKAAAQAAARSAAQLIQHDRGDGAMGCQCNQKRDAMQREIDARKKMIEDSANAYKTKIVTADDEHTDDAPSAPLPGESREAAARRMNAEWSRNAHKAGRR